MPKTQNTNVKFLLKRENFICIICYIERWLPPTHKYLWHTIQSSTKFMPNNFVFSSSFFQTLSAFMHCSGVSKNEVKVFPSTSVQFACCKFFSASVFFTEEWKKIWSRSRLCRILDDWKRSFLILTTTEWCIVEVW